VKKGHAATVAVGAISLGAVGAKIGIAGFFGAMNGMLPCAIIGAYIGHKVYKGVTGGDAAQGFKEGYASKAEALKARRLALMAAKPELVPVMPAVAAAKPPPEPKSPAGTDDARKTSRRASRKAIGRGPAAGADGRARHGSDDKATE